MKRYQECGFWTKAWRRRWYLITPYWFFIFWVEFLAEPDRFLPCPCGCKKLVKVPRTGFRTAVQIATSLAESEMGWYFTYEEVFKK